MDGTTLRKIGTLGGPIHIKKDLNNMYFGGNGPGGPFSKEKLFGANGPLHPGMKEEHQLALSALYSDTKKTLVGELVDQTHLTREEAEKTVSELLRKGLLEEVEDPNLGKILIFKEVRR